MSLPRPYRDSTAMAKTLVTYMSDARAIRSAILGEFDHSPSVQTISAMRGGWLRSVDKARRGKRAPSSHAMGWDWTGRVERAAMEAASRAFVGAIERERRA